MSSPDVVALRLSEEKLHIDEPLLLGKPKSGHGMLQRVVLVRLGELLLHLGEG